MINAGDGGHQHPTQTLTDLMTIRRRKGRLDDLTIGLCGDLKFGRTVHSLIKTMARCQNIRFVLISPEELRVPDYIINDVLEANGIEYKETRSLEDSMADLDILYMTRVQKERFFNEEDYIRLKNSYILTKEKMALATARPAWPSSRTPAPTKQSAAARTSSRWRATPPGSTWMCWPTLTPTSA